MPYRTGTWGPEAQERSKRRLDYFHTVNLLRYQRNKDEELANAKIYYELHREEILERMAIAYSKKDTSSKTSLRTRNKLKYQLHKEEIKAKCAAYYKLHREEILAKKAKRKHRQK